MFFIAQLLGLTVSHLYATIQIPYGLGPQENISPIQTLFQLIISLCFAILLILGLMKLKAEMVFRYWFFAVVVVALGVSINAFLNYLPQASLISLIIALPLAYLKIFRRNIIVHNFTELLIYPGIAAMFVPLLSIWTAVILLLVISVYDMYAVWHSGIMQKMAKYQMQKVKVFSGFLIPYILPSQKKLLEKSHSKEMLKKVKISVAMLGGGDVVFPIILAGVVLAARGLIPAVLVSLGAALGLSALLYASKKGKFYPAMPFITLGCLLGLLVGIFL